MYAARPGLFVGLGLLLIPIVLVVTAFQWLLVNGLDAVGSVTGEPGGHLRLPRRGRGDDADAARASGSCRRRRRARSSSSTPAVTSRPATRTGWRSDGLRPLLGAIAVAVAAGILLATSVVLLPIAIWLIVRWSLLAPVVELEDRGALEALHRSAGLVRRRWLRVATLVGLGSLIALLAGPLVGALLIFVSNSSLALLNLVAGIVYAIALPFVALVTCYVYFDARVREELEPRDVRRELPAEISIRSGLSSRSHSPGGAGSCGRRVESRPVSAAVCGGFIAAPVD